MTLPYLSYNVKVNHNNGSTGVLVVLPFMCILYRVRNPTQDLRATSVEQVSISISSVQDSLPNIITINQRLM